MTVSDDRIPDGKHNSGLLASTYYGVHSLSQVAGTARRVSPHDAKFRKQVHHASGPQH